MSAPNPAPGSGVAAIDQAIAAMQLGQGLTAIDILREIIAAAPPLGEQWATVVRLCGQLHDDDAALAAARRLRAAQPGGVPTAFILARALERTGRATEAVSVLEPAARAGELGFSELFQMSRMLMFAGQLDNACALARRLLQEQPGNPFVWARLAELKRFKVGDADIPRLVRLQPELAAASMQARAAGAWALAKAYVDINDDGLAAEMLGAAAAARRGVVQIDLDSIARSAQASLEAIAPEEFAGNGAGRNEGSRVIFILGPQRSGTTLVEQILGRHPAIGGGGELKFLWLMKPALGDFTAVPIASYLEKVREQRRGQDPWAEIRSRYFALADERFGPGARFTDKQLSNHLRLAVILKAFPGARIVRCRRDPLAIAWSCWRARFDEESWWNSDPAWIARHIAVYERLLDDWAARIPGLFIDLHYERLVSDPDAEIPLLLSACDLDDHPATRRPQDSARSVMTSSFLQVREPMDAGRIDAWRRFPIATGPLRQALAAEGLMVEA